MVQPDGSLVDNEQFLEQTARPVTIQGLSAQDGGRLFQFGSPAFVAPYGAFNDEGGTPVGVAAMRTVLGM